MRNLLVFFWMPGIMLDITEQILTAFRRLRSPHTNTSFTRNLLEDSRALVTLTPASRILHISAARQYRIPKASCLSKSFPGT